MKHLYLNVLAYLIMIAVNIAAETIPINEQTTGEISNRLPVFIQPANYAFSIWGFIYVLLAIWLLYSFFPSRRSLPIYSETSLLFIVSCLLNSLWIIVWHYELFLLSVVVMLSLLVTLLLLYRKLTVLMTQEFERVPFSVYLGWIIIASLVNISYYLVYINWDVFVSAQVIWTIVFLFFGFAIALSFRVTYLDRWIPLVISWAYVGIGIKQFNSNPFLSYVAFGLAGVLLISSIFIKKKSF
ncbi:tryptophan-rich sensory protein [Bacillus suaedaesalsae]|uniref:Tryptophan-rich sensory protein n=1 Tax=Bacillus suaedaesalsae TaxID=2810349 RepID=A0ABS2DDI7_9BACI|nr:tryptophan-rich sensory protein [Bacillus suaedaesalsae]MBM6616524.1 tryptophan-rich sensory protein [Bacillus suaedaesalsae]